MFKAPAIETLAIDVPGGELTVRGLSMEDVFSLVASHRAVMAEAFEGLASDPGATLDAASLMGERLLVSAPGLAAQIIAQAADAIEDMDAIRKLAFPIQVEALEKVASLTFRTEEDLKKVVETVIRAMQGLTPLLTSQQI